MSELLSAIKDAGPTVVAVAAIAAAAYQHRASLNNSERTQIRDRSFQREDRDLDDARRLFDAAAGALDEAVRLASVVRTDAIQAHRTGGATPRAAIDAAEVSRKTLHAFAARLEIRFGPGDVAVSILRGVARDLRAFLALCTGEQVEDDQSVADFEAEVTSAFAALEHPGTEFREAAYTRVGLRLPSDHPT